MPRSADPHFPRAASSSRSEALPERGHSCPLGGGPIPKGGQECPRSESAWPGSILVIRGGALGDFILTLPVLAALRHRFPAARLDLLGYPAIAQLASGWINQLQPLESPALAGFFASDTSLDPAMTRFFAGFDAIVSYLSDPNRLFQNNVARCFHGEYLAAPARPPANDPGHATDFFLEPLARWGVTEANPIPRLAFLPPWLDRPGSTPRLAVHPGSGSPLKNWPESHWSALIERVIRQTHWHVLMIGGEADADRPQRLAAVLPPDRVTLALHLPLTELALRLAECHAYIGHDSGVSHLAAACGLPGLALWGDTAEAVWRPRSDRFGILRDPAGLAALSPDRVLAEVLIRFGPGLTTHARGI